MILPFGWLNGITPTRAEWSFLRALVRPCEAHNPLLVDPDAAHNPLMVDPDAAYNPPHLDLPIADIEPFGDDFDMSGVVKDEIAGNNSKVEEVEESAPVFDTDIGAMVLDNKVKFFRSQ
ncbi:hypothetical protein AgCh_032943 [Apium graveolens]